MVSLLRIAWKSRKRLTEVTLIERDDVHHHLSRRAVTPAICYDDCDGAYKIAQSQGKTDALCKKGSLFQTAYNACRECISENTDSGKDAVKDYVEPQFEQFLDYCDGKNGTEATTEMATTSGAKTTADMAESEVTSPPSSAPERCDSCSVLTFTDFRSQVIKLTVDANKITASLRKDSSSGPDIATIVGPVVPSVVLLILLGFLGFRWLRRRKAAKAQQGTLPDEEEPKEGKAQLHSECISRPTFELEGSAPEAVDDTMRPKDTSEMAANEPAAHEMSTEKRTTRKLVGS
ncbi:hypothetical protein FDENT_8328 [Fusarium denticulatum]|uniref:Uncharacterized protein n=1 Tax=Fusarium denticulatum TaxID=48507 RepID=A0A8H5U6S3_9HYPO|nr:hypothetical protein FDENT_8328 [Fusarium denticulatum]